MKVFIRNTQTGWYFQEPSKWTPDQGAACNLGQVARAVERIFEAHLESVEILLSYDEPRYDLVLPVPPSPSRADPLRPRHAGENSHHGEGAQPPTTRKKERPI
jgi:hypothetical protein